MSWRGTEGGLAAARAGHDVVMSPTSHCYLDYYQAKTGEPMAFGGYLPLSKSYSFEPVPEALPADQRHHILGVQGNVWGEKIANLRYLEYMAFPRECALAEVGCSQPEDR
jgi:hexosaminidase